MQMQMKMKMQMQMLICNCIIYKFVPVKTIFSCLWLH